MNFIFFELAFIAVIFAKCAHGSRLTNNEVSLNPLAPQMDSAKTLTLQQDYENSSKVNGFAHHTLPSGSSGEVYAASNNQLNTKDNGSVALSNPASGNQFPSKEKFINIFAQRVSQHIFHNAPRNITSLDTDKSQGNIKTLLWSPISVYQSLLPLYYASAGETEKELQQLLLPSMNESSLVTNVNIDSNLPTLLNFTDLNNVLSGSRETLSSVTGLFARNNLRLSSEYVQEVQTELKNVDVKSTDFNNPANAATSINQWVNNSTRGLMSSAVDESQLYPDTFMMIVNCVRFKASWKSRFNSKLTKTSNFYGVSGLQKVQMMKQIGTHKFVKYPIIYSSDYEEQPGYTKGSDISFSALEMPYSDEDFSSIFILPETTEKLQETLDFVGKVGVEEIRQMLHHSDVEILMPKFKINSNVNLEKALIENGLTTLFNPLKANLAKLVASDNQDKIMDDAKMDKPLVNDLLSPPYLGSIIHRTIFETTEEGTTAAALTALSIVPLSALSQDMVYRFNLNRPFIILLVKNNTLVFQGVIADLVGQDFNVADITDKNDINDKKSNTAPIGNSLLYPSDSKSKAELDKMSTSNGQESKTGSVVGSNIKESLSQSQQSEESQDIDTEDRSWWVPKKIPAYLLPMNETFLNSSSSTTTVNNNTADNHKHTDTIEQTPSPVPAKVPFEPIHFTKYQQPEPKDPNGIRFPATIPQVRNKVNIKPRFHHDNNVKRRFDRWIYVY